jgi:glycosyltransferase involved in cell wall biosynthesis
MLCSLFYNNSLLTRIVDALHNSRTMQILFVDPCTPKPYDTRVLEQEALGGTEATVTRLAESLASRGHIVKVAQHCRSEVSNTGSVLYAPFGHPDGFRPTHVIVLRAPAALRVAKKQFPSAKLYIWCHDIFGGPVWTDGFPALVETQTVPVVVSDWHKSQMYEAMRAINFRGVIPARRIYNPIADNLAPDDTPVDKSKLVFFSSPHKGLERTLQVFERFVDFPELADMKLYIANPGYFKDAETGGLRNVVNLGAVPHSEVIRHVRSSLAVFHLNNVFPETFGLVHAEANAVGTPFLSSRVGATPEVTDHPGELIDVSDTKAVIDRICAWRKYGRPKVRGSPNFKLSRITTEWEQFLTL